MGACASKFTVLKNASAAPPPDVKHEEESREVNLVEEVVVKKDDTPAVEDEANRRQSLGHLLKENEETKVSAETDCKGSENVKQEDATEVKPEAVADAPAQDETEKSPVADGLKSKGLEGEILACQIVEIEAQKVEEKPAETVKLEIKTVEALNTEHPEENKAVEIPETLKTLEPEVQKPEKDEEKPAEAHQTPYTKKPEEQKPASGAEKKETEGKSTATTEIETPEKIPEVTEEQKQAVDTGKNEVEEKPAENTVIKTSDKVEDKHVLEPQTTENCCVEQKKPASDAEKPKAEEKKANS